MRKRYRNYTILSGAAMLGWLYAMGWLYRVPGSFINHWASFPNTIVSVMLVIAFIISVAHLAAYYDSQG